ARLFSFRSPPSGSPPRFDSAEGNVEDDGFHSRFALSSANTWSAGRPFALPSRITATRRARSLSKAYHRRVGPLVRLERVQQGVSELGPFTAPRPRPPPPARRRRTRSPARAAARAAAVPA